MALEVIYGESRNRSLASELARNIAAVVDRGTVYLGYPVLASADDTIQVDALLVSEERGLVAFQLADGIPSEEAGWDDFVADQDRLYGALQAHLIRHEQLRSGRRLPFNIQTVTVFPTDPGQPPSGVEGDYCDMDSIGAVLSELPGIDADTAHSLNSVVQRVSTIRPAKRRKGVTRADSRGAVLKELERQIANLDKWQNRAAIETPEGPQRIRGLAGSGKTIVLALKAAYLHSQNPEWRIALTFWSRALYQQFEDLITRFAFEHSNDKPDFAQLQILHAWGSSSREGMYSLIARSIGVTPRDFRSARSRHGMENAFQGICAELLAATTQGEHAPIFDAVLIDEAQDLPAEFFQLVHRFAKAPKRIIWAYDELQRLSETAMPSMDELFGSETEGAPIHLSDSPGEARGDIVLPVCYRNPPWTLATAHAIGLGVYRSGGLVQHPDDPELWTDIGYEVRAGDLRAGHQVELERSSGSYPQFLVDLLTPSDAVSVHTFEGQAEQDSWVAAQIAANLGEEELERDDILVVLPDAYTARRRSLRFAEALERHGIHSHLAGVGSSVDVIFESDSVAMAHIYRAKGNEAPMVYVLDSQYAISDHNQITRRNTLFAAVTRSRAWVRICGWGDRMETLATELDAVRNADFRLKFPVPSAEELEQLRRIHRDRSDAEMASVKRATRNAEELLRAFDRGEIDIEDLPPRLRTRLLRLVLEELHDGTD